MFRAIIGIVPLALSMQKTLTSDINNKVTTKSINHETIENKEKPWNRCDYWTSLFGGGGS